MTNEDGRFDDATLIGALLRVTDPYAAAGYVRARPNELATPVIVAEYGLTPPGGKKANPDALMVWCAKCQEENHWLGLVISVGDNAHSIGHECAAKHYGATFAGVRRDFNERRKRQRLLTRLTELLVNEAPLSSAIQSILNSDGLALIDKKRNEIKSAAPNAFLSLQGAVMSGGGLDEYVQVRDIAAEQRRDEHRDKSGDPINTQERRALGSLAGASLIRERDDARARLVKLKAAIAQALAIAKRDTTSVTTAEMTRIIVALDNAHRDAASAIADAERAHEFFSEANGQRLHRWAAHRSGFAIKWHPTKLEFDDRKKGTSSVAAMTRLTFPELPKA